MPHVVNIFISAKQNKKNSIIIIVNSTCNQFIRPNHFFEIHYHVKNVMKDSNKRIKDNNIEFKLPEMKIFIIFYLLKIFIFLMIKWNK
ncbi:hypothetical protein BpHYR1_002882 [Brachionus plicatilis]|uniref:Uncharacterized protein n=1 Tax=Brachionus plicatilis TaxID=10195 RepID=A0A3M7P8J5_BRAPC|nr:hypothetical protein BpHYR1_002882 [Brachionus plicatilis]